MKKSKIMLTGIGVLAVMGGALAFKANHVGANKYCYTFTNVANAAVNTGPKGLLAPPLTTSGTFTLIKYTLTNNIINCSITPPTCTKTARYTTAP
jgi:hypothetical protein